MSNGYTLDELTAISGAHTIGFRAPAGGGPQPAPLTPTPFAFNTGGCPLVYGTASPACVASPCVYHLAGASSSDSGQRSTPLLPPLLTWPARCHLPPHRADYFQLVLNGAAPFRTDNVLGREPATQAVRAACQ